MKLAICPGSFDPVTYGHLDIIRRSASLVDKLIVAAFLNPTKHYMFTTEERIAMLKETTKDIPNVEVDAFDGLLNEYAAKKNCHLLIRGLRAFSDFEYEFQMAGMNQKLMPEVETIFLTPAEQFQFISGTFVREIAMMGGDVSGFVPQNIRAALERKRIELKQTSL